MARSLRIFAIGKTKESWLQQALADYHKRIEKEVALHLLCLRDDGSLERQTADEKGLICLDPKGRLLSSEGFSQLLMSRLESQSQGVAFAIGGPDGLSPLMRQRGQLISFSPMIFTHQAIRLLLFEQLYRALAIAKGSPYHRP